MITSLCNFKRYLIQLITCRLLYDKFIFDIKYYLYFTITKVNIYKTEKDLS